MDDAPSSQWEKGEGKGVTPQKRIMTKGDMGSPGGVAIEAGRQRRDGSRVRMARKSRCSRQKRAKMGILGVAGIPGFEDWAQKS